MIIPYSPVLIRSDKAMFLVSIIELNIKVDEDVSLQKVDSPVDLLVLFELLCLLDWKGGIIQILSLWLFFVITEESKASPAYSCRLEREPGDRR